MTSATTAARVKDGAPPLDTASVQAAPAVQPVERPSNLTLGNRLMRALWGLAWLLLFRPSPRVLHGWRRTLLRLFGARMGRGAVVHPSCRIFAPWNLEMGEHACLAFDVDCYCVDRVVLGPYSVVSQYAFLCTASHDTRRLDMPLTTAPIFIGAHAWVAADVFVGPGVTIGEGSVVRARSVALADVPTWTIAGGDPARALKPRILDPSQTAQAARG